MASPPTENDKSMEKSNVDKKSRSNRQQEPRGCRHPPEAISEMSKWLGAHSKHPYIDPRERYKLSKKTGLTGKQVETWLSNARSRLQKSGGSRTSEFNFKKSNNHPESSVDVMEAWTRSHSASPTTEEKRELAAQASLTLEQVSNWFQDKRKKLRKLH